MKRIEEMNVPHPPLHAVSIQDLLHSEATDVTVLGIVYDVSEPQAYRCRDGIVRTTQKVVVVDETKRAVEVTLWADQLNKLDGYEATAVILENVTPRDFRGKRTISTSSSTVIKQMGPNPTSEQVTLQQWWDNSGNEEQFKDLTIEENQDD